MKIDISTLGYKWKGAYVNDALYQKRDVVRKDGKVMWYTGSSWEPMAVGQLNAQFKGEIPTAGTATILTGVEGQELMVGTGGALVYRFSEGRRATAAIALASDFNDGVTGYTAGSANSMAVLMNDGTVKAWGAQNNGQVGDGIVADRARTLPVTVAFPYGTPPIVKLIAGTYAFYAIDANGRLWGWGWNSYGTLGQGDTTTRGLPVLISGKGDLPLNDVVVDVKCGAGSWWNYGAVMIRTQNGRVYFMGANRQYCSGTLFGSTDNITTPKLVVKSTEVNVVDMWAWGFYYAATWLLDDKGRLWGAGEQNTIGRINNNAEPNVPHQLWTPSESNPVKYVRGEESDSHVSAGEQYYRRYMIIHQNGQISTWGHNEIYNVSSYVGSNQYETWVPALDTRISNVKDGYCSSGQYNQQVVLKNDGTVWGIGYDGHNSINGAGNANNWTQITQLGSNNVKIQGGGSRYGKWGAVLRSNGTMVCYGGWYGGSGGGYAEARFDQVLLDKPIKDFQVTGVMYDSTSYLTCYCLCDDGNVYSFGSSYYGKLGMDDDGENMYTPSPVIL